MKSDALEIRGRAVRKGRSLPLTSHKQLSTLSTLLWNDYCRRIDEFGKKCGLTAEETEIVDRIASCIGDLKTLPEWISDPGARRFFVIFGEKPVAVCKTIVFIEEHKRENGINSTGSVVRDFVCTALGFEIVPENRKRFKDWLGPVLLNDLSDSQLKHVRFANGTTDCCGLNRSEARRLLSCGTALRIDEPLLTNKQVANSIELARAGFLQKYRKPKESERQARERLVENIKKIRGRARKRLL